MYFLLCSSMLSVFLGLFQDCILVLSVTAIKGERTLFDYDGNAPAGITRILGILSGRKKEILTRGKSMENMSKMWSGKDTTKMGCKAAFDNNEWLYC